MVMLKGSPPNRSGRAETQLCRVVNTMAAGKVPPAVSPFLCGARLHAGIKKEGGAEADSGWGHPEAPL